MAIESYPRFLQTQSYPARQLRFQQEAFTPNGEGVLSRDDMRVSQRGAGANMSVDIAAGSAVVRGDSVARQGLYHVVNDAVANVAVTSNSSGNPRIDRVLLNVADSTDSGSGSDISTFSVLAGTPTGGATLDNLSGAAAVPINALHLADVLVANGAASIVDANIRSRRSFAKVLVPPLTTDVDMIPLQYVSGVPLAWGLGQGGGIHGTVHDVHQAAALAYLPRRIVNATRMRWKYGHDGATALTGNYVLALFDASGRKIVDTGALTFIGAAGTHVARSEVIAATTLEAGLYYLFIGVGATNAGAIGYPSAYPRVQAGTGYVGSPYPNTVLRAATGGISVPTTLFGLTDVVGSSALDAPGVPQIALSVG